LSVRVLPEELISFKINYLQRGSFRGVSNFTELRQISPNSILKQN
jgi:hypothetical protein